MNNTKHKLKSLEVVAFTRNRTKFLSFKVNLTLKVKVNFISFQTDLRQLDDQ